MMEPINNLERQSLKHQVIESIKSHIIENNLSAGDKLPTERKFTEMYGVSRSVVREALSYLENIGVLTIQQGRGAFISDSNISKLLDGFFFLWELNHGDIKEISNLRIIFETAAIDEIIKKDNTLAVQSLNEVLIEARTVTNPADYKIFDAAFHKKLLETTDNTLFQQLTNMVTNYFFQLQSPEMSPDEYLNTIKIHQDIVDAIAVRNGIKAKEILAHHIKAAKI